MDQPKGLELFIDGKGALRLQRELRSPTGI